MKFYISLLTVFFLYLNVFAQKTGLNGYSSKYTYIYKLTDQDALDIHLEKQTKRPLKYLHTLVDSVLTSQSDKYEFKNPGYYFLVYTIDGDLKLDERIVSTLCPQLLHNGKDFQLVLYDQTGEQIKEAEIWLDRKKINYDPKMNSYIERNTLEEGILKIQYKGELLFRKIIVRNKERNFLYNFDDAISKSIKSWRDKRSNNRTIRGYLLTDKPMYRLNDTLKLKGIIYHKNKLVREQLTLSLVYKKSSAANAATTTVKLATLKPDKSGNYLYQFKLTDTLRIDYNYRLVLSNKKISVQKEFMLKDYRLEDYSFSVSSEKDKYSSGDPIRIFLTASNILGNPLPGAKAEVRVSCNSIKVVEDIQEYTPFKILDTTIFFLNNKTAVLELTSDLIPYLKGTYRAHIKFTDANNHSQEEEMGWEYSNLREKFVLTEKNNKAEINFIQDGKILRVKGVLWEENEKYNFKKEVDFPYSYSMDQYRVPKRVVYNNRDYPIEFIRKQAPDFIFSKTNDTIRFRAANEDSIKFWYQLWKEDKLIQSGYSTQLEFHDISSKKKYQFKAEYFLNGHYYTASSKFPDPEEEYHIESNLPATISPGNKVNLKVKITDTKNRPVKNMNLTAGAVDAKFQYDHVPALSRRIETEEKVTKDISAIDNVALHKWEDITPDHYRLFHLDTVLFHKFIRPVKGGFYQHSTTNREYAEVAPHIFIEGRKLWVYYILIDHKPVYLTHYSYENHSNDMPFSIKSSEGYHTVTIRTESRTIEVDSVYFKKGHKLDFSIDPTIENQKNIQVRDSGKRLSKEEFRRLNRKIIRIRNYANTAIFISTKHQEIKTESGCEIVVFNNEPFTVIRNGIKYVVQMDSSDLLEVHSYSVDQFKLKKHKKSCAKKSLYKMGKDNFSQDPGQKTEDLRKPFIARSTGELLLNPSGSYMDVSTKPGNGTFFFQYPSSFQYLFYELKSFDIPFGYNTYSLPLVYNVPPGKYSLVVRIDSLNCFIKDTLLIKGDTLTVVDLSSLKPLKRVDLLPYPKTNKYYNILEFGLRSYPYNDGISSNGNLSSNQNSTLYSSISYDERRKYRWGRFNRRMRYMALGAGISLSQWDPNNAWLTRSIIPSGNIFFARRFGSRTTIHIDFQFMNGMSKYQSRNYHTHQLAASSFLNWDLIRHAGRYQKRPDFVPFLKAGFSAFVDMGTYYRGGGQKVYNPSVFFIQPMVSGGAGLRYKVSKQIDAELSVIQYFNLVGFSFGQNRSVGSFNQVRLSLAYIIPSKVICPKFDGGMGRKSYKPTVHTPRYRSDSDEKGGVLTKESLTLTEDLVLIPKKSPEVNYQTPLKVRSQLSDVGYWKPVLITDANGKAEFTVMFPEDITLWKTYMLGIGKNNKQFTRLHYLPSILPVTVKLNIPRFVIEGDEFSAYGNLSDFTGSATQKIQYSLSTNNYLFKKDTIFNKVLAIPALIKATSSDTMEITAKVVTENNSGDAELQKLPVLNVGMQQAKGDVLMVYKDTTITVKMEKNMEGKLQITNTTLDEMLRQVENLRRYPYACMEQTASKLKGLLLLKSIYEKQQKKFDEDAEILKLIEKLEKGQKENGSWGWWPGTDTDLYVSSYILRILYKATEMGYTSKSVAPATAFLKRFRQDEILSWDVLVALSELSIPIDSSNLQRVVKLGTNLTDFQKLQRIRILQRNHYPFSIQEVMKLKKETVKGGAYFGYDTYHWATNSTQASLLAYRIIEEQKGYDQELEKIIRYLFEVKEEGYYRNTVETAMVVDLILSNIKEKATEPPVVRINNKEIKKFPYSAILQKDSSYSITYHTSQPVYTSYHTIQWNKKPVKSGEFFGIETAFKKDNAPVNNLKAGNIYELEVKVKVERAASYVMIEVPIPAGCLQSEGAKKNVAETYRENFKEKTNIYLTSVRPGYYTFVVPLKASYPGNYTLNPAKISMMYFPTVNGNEEVKKVVIE